MQKTSTRALLLGVLALVVSGCETKEQDTSSILIVNAMIYDGSGSDAYAGAVRFEGDRIVDVGDLDTIDGEHVINAGGLALAPGFIDTHSHHDEELDKYRHMPGVLSQGVTTIVRGMDGSSGDYRSVSVFNMAFEKAPAAVNVASFSAHNSLRQYVLGEDNRRYSTDGEIAAMAALLRSDMQAGALGLSTGLEYEPGIFSATEEVIALARVAAENNGRYSSHLRDEDDRFIEALNEILQIGRDADIPVHVSHIKLADKLAWGTTAGIIAMLDAARADGVEITAEIYPYERWASNLAVLFPERDYSSRETAEYTFERTASAEDILLISYPANPDYNGKTVAEIAGLTERDEVTTLLELSQAAADHRRETGEDTGIIAKSMDDADIGEFMRWPYMNICSDGWHGGHPRGYGSFPRVLGRFAREMGILTMPEAIYKMTGLAAENMGIAGRGRIAAGYYADLVLFDPDTIIDHATMQEPTAVSSGVEQVWVNGVLAFENGEPTGTFAGRIIRPASSPP
jgi:N-acyl-D-amino-acid deacylase